MASDDIAYERHESEDFLLAVPADSLTVAQVEAMEPIVRHELEAYVERGGPAWTATKAAPTPLPWPPVEETVDEELPPVKVTGKVASGAKVTGTEGAKVDG